MKTSLGPHVCLYASFDAGFDADRSRGDPQASVSPEVVTIDPSGGRYGGAAVFAARDRAWAEDELVYAAAGNFPYRRQEFAGTISLWLACDPDADLHPDFPVDPFHISRHPADGSYYLDLTRPNDERYGSPRKLRFGIYGDSPQQDKLYGGQLLVVGELDWRRGHWHHLCATWQHANSGQPNGSAAVYIDGIRRAWMEGYPHALTWDIDALRIGLGQRFVGRIDELLILDTELEADEVAELAARDEPAAAMF